MESTETPGNALIMNRSRINMKKGMIIRARDNRMSICVMRETYLNPVLKKTNDNIQQ